MAGQPLLPQHQKLIDASGISPEVAAARGYYSAEKQAELRKLGFSTQQCLVPALVIPLHNVHGERVSYQVRPDDPRVNRDGKPIKYETPRGASTVLDVPRPIREKIGDPQVPLFITEGVRKADAAVAAGLCCVALMGVWGFRGSNGLGGTTALPDWEWVAPNGRQVYIVYDSDVMVKPTVHAALARSMAMLMARGAVVRVIYLRAGPDGAKVGLDDYLAAGHSVQDLIQLATENLREPPRGEETPVPYRQTEGGIVWLRRRPDGQIETLPLTNFDARIVTEVTRDDGAEQSKELEIETSMDGVPTRFSLSARDFAAMSWPVERVGARATIHAGATRRDHARAAIQLLSDPERRTIYTHLGWHKIGGEWVFLHAGGALGAGGVVPGIDVDVPSELRTYCLPEPPKGEAAAAAMRASLRFLEVAPSEQSWPLLAWVPAAVLGPVLLLDATLWVFGPSGERKTTVGLLVLCHFGPFDEPAALPANFLSTPNALERVLFLAKDVGLLVDDFCSQADPKTGAQHEQAATRVIRGVGNRQGRNRCDSAGELRGEKPPRALPIVTAELPPPGGQSSEARTFQVDWLPGCVNLERLSRAQKEDAPLYPQATAAFIAYLAPRLDGLRESVRDRVAIIRKRLEAEGAGHGRVAETAAKLYVAAAVYLEVAQELGAITEADRHVLQAQAYDVSVTLARRTGARQAECRLTVLFREILNTLLVQKRVYLAGRDDQAPNGDPESWGWLQDGSGHWTTRPTADKIGWVDEHQGIVYFLPGAVFKAVMGYARETQSVFPGRQRALREALQNERLIVCTTHGRADFSLRVRNVTHHCWPVRIADLEVAPNDPSTPPDAGNADGRTPGVSDVSDVSSSENPTDPARASSAYDAGGGQMTDAVDPPLFSKTGDIGDMGDKQGNEPLLVLQPIHRAAESCLQTDNGLGDMGDSLPVHVVTRDDDLLGLHEALEAAEVVALGVETTGPSARQDRVRLLSVVTEWGCWVTKRGCWLIDLSAVDIRPLFPLLGMKRLVIHNAVFDLAFLKAMGFEPGAVTDTMLLSQLVHAGTREEQTLVVCAKRELGVELPNALRRWDWCGPLSATQLTSAARAVQVLLRLERALARQVAESGLEQVAAIERRCLPAILWMGEAGVGFDAAAWETAVAAAEGEVAAREAALNAAAPPAPAADLGVPWNWYSPAICARVLREAGCEVQDAADETLAALEHPLADLLRQYRASRTRAATFGSAWPGLVENGRLYPQWRQIGAASGRMSCRAPNVQQLPRAGRSRDCIIAGAGRVLVKADYSQIELRIAARITGDEALRAAYQSGEDLHTQMARRLTGRDEVTKEDRQLAKAVNFGFLYGMAAEGFRRYVHREYGLTLTRAQALAYREAFFREYPGLARWHQEVWAVPAEETRTLTGRRRLLTPDRPGTVRLNTPVQGTGADGLKRALALLWERREQCPGAVPVIASHDEIVVECDADPIEAVTEWLRQAMVDGMAPLIAPVPVVVEVTAGRSWAG